MQYLNVTFRHLEVNYLIGCFSGNFKFRNAG